MSDCITQIANPHPEDLSNTIAGHADFLTLTGNGLWVEYTWYIADAGFHDYIQGAHDFRFFVEGDPPPQVLREASGRRGHISDFEKALMLATGRFTSLPPPGPIGLSTMGLGAHFSRTTVCETPLVGSGSGPSTR